MWKFLFSLINYAMLVLIDYVTISLGSKGTIPENGIYTAMFYHGIGLLNVKAVVNKYGGDMVLSCDENEFKAVVIL